MKVNQRMFLLVLLYSTIKVSSAQVTMNSGEGKLGEADMFRGKILVAADSVFPKNGEGSTIRLKDNRLLHMVSRHMKGRGGSDFWPSIIAKMYSSDNGVTWTKPVKVFENLNGTRTCMQPSLIHMSNGELGVAYSKYESSEKAVKVFRYSKNGGDTWSAEILMTPADGYYSAAHNRMVLLSNGNIIIPLHKKFVENGATKIYTKITRSADNGRSWKLGVQTIGFNESGLKKSVFAEATLAETKGGHLALLGRTEKGHLYATSSIDYGQTWTEVKKTSLESPPASLNMIKIPNSDDLMVIWQSCCNSGKRLTLSSAISTDAGETWKWQREIVTVAPEYGDAQYPTALADGNNIIITYRAVKAFYKPKYVMEEQLITLPLSWFYVGRDFAAKYEVKERI